MLRIGILGAGAMGAMHAAAYANMHGVEVVGAFSRSLERARSIASICGARPFDNAQSLIDEVAAIDVCLPTPNHCEFVIAALDRGKHVFCETPLALHLKEAAQMRDAARRSDRLLQVGLLMRSIGAYNHLLGAIASCEHGRLLTLSTFRLGSYLRPGAPDHKPHYGEPVFELMTFDFDVVNWLMGQPVRISASGGGEVTALLEYDDGRHASVTASGRMPAGFPFTSGFRALFEDAVFELNIVFEKGPPKSVFTVATGRTPPQPVPIVGANPYEVELRRFVDCIAGKADPALLDADRAIDALVLSLATQRALNEGCTVEIAPS